MASGIWFNGKISEVTLLTSLLAHKFAVHVAVIITTLNFELNIRNEANASQLIFRIVPFSMLCYTRKSRGFGQINLDSNFSSTTLCGFG